ncbi:hypothetical protein [Actinocatenispora sera]|uniref:Uncharacterized protein n=1 Tax=Actinocatenispora sera TaxID=390989 RepID=A0A810KT81_9ACTN|nr:hypothetical protein [Actinocatenispora sera]BCJ26433.1 hypothetical protein Asera_05410 [Actinocatenispora sera]
MSHQTILAEMTLTPGQFKAIAVFYVIAGLICLGIGVLNLRKKSTGSGVLSLLVGIAGVVYGAYILIGDPDTVWVSFKIFILPVIAIIYGIVALVKGKAGGSSSGPAQAAPYNAAGAQPGWNQQPGQPMPGQPAPGQPAPGQMPAGQYGQPAGYPQAQQPGAAPTAYGQPVAQQQWGQGAAPQPVQRDPQSPPPPPPAQTDQPLWPGQNR